MRVLAVSVTERGRTLATALPWERAHGRLAETVRDRWPDVDALVLFLAVGAAVRVVAPLLGHKGSDPAVVCVDEAGRFAVALCGGHAAGANDLARHVAELVGAEPVLTTATDSAGMAALDVLPGYTAEGDVAGVTAAMLDGRRPVVAVDGDVWPAPPGLSVDGRGPDVVLVTDRVVPSAPGLVALHPPSLVAGVGTSTGASAAEVEALLGHALADAGLSRSSVAEVATLDRRAADPAIVALGLPVRAWPAATLAGVPVPSASAVVEAAVGTPSVAEAAALTAAGPGSELVALKRASTHATVAVARRRRPPGRVRVVGLGPGHARHRTPAAESAVRGADVVIGYGPYVDACAALLSPHQEIVRSPVGEEVVRAKQALAEAAAGRQVALVSSGDAGVYGMASLVLEVASDAAGGAEVEVVPGVTAALAGAALLGAPLGHDHAVISLSDLLTPWEVIEARLRAAAQADLVVALYNPRSRRRTWQLDAARDVLLEHRPPDTPVGLVTDAARPGERVDLTTLGALDAASVGMTTCLLVGSTATRVLDGRMVTARGYTA